MIARLKGKVDSLGDESLIIDVGGVGYQVFCSSRTLRKMALNENVILEVETHVREDHIQTQFFEISVSIATTSLLMCKHLCKDAANTTCR